jgi:epoxyqueuosine reductase
MNDTSLPALAERIKAWAAELGFGACGIAPSDPGEHSAHLQRWLDAGHHGEMQWMHTQAALRADPAGLLPGAQRVIAVRLDYLSTDEKPLDIVRHGERAYVARYALGRDYHKLMRKRLAQLADRIRAEAPEAATRACVDSAPVLERAFAEQAGLGWIGKNTMLIHPDAGSWFFLGEILTSLPLPLDEPFASQHCGSCTACLDICPTQAFTAPWQLDARRCISYLTIEHKGSIAEDLRPLMGNRIFGCDDCVAICPWNKFAELSGEGDFVPRHDLDTAQLMDLFGWDETTFLARTEGSAIRRSGYESWLRNIAIALGNAPHSMAVLEALQARASHPSAVVREHVQWALKQHSAPA